MQIIAESDIGYVGFEGNELTIGSKVDEQLVVVGRPSNRSLASGYARRAWQS